MRNGSLAQYDWLSGKTIWYVDHAAGLAEFFDWVDLVVDSSARKPALVCVDTETYGPQELWDDAVRLGAIVKAIKAERDALPHKRKRTDDQHRRWLELKVQQDAAEEIANAAAANARQSGLCLGINHVRLVQVYAGGENVFVLDLLKLKRMGVDARWLLSNTLFREDIQWVGHNIQFDVACLYATTCAGNWPADGYLPAHTPHCTMLQSQALISLSYIRKNLETRVGTVLNRALDKSHQVSDWGREDLTPGQVNYACIDVIATWDLYAAQRKMVLDRTGDTDRDENCGGVYEILRGAIKSTAQITAAGIEFDLREHARLVDTVQDTYARTAADTMTALQELYRVYPISPQVENINSTVQWNKLLGHWLSNDQMDQWPKTDKGALSVGYDAITIALGRSIVPAAVATVIECFRLYLDVKTTHDRLGEKYQRWAVEVADDRWRIFPSYMIGGAETGRFSASDPPLQQIPRDEAYRKLFKARPGYTLVVCDYGQIEIRVAAVLSGDAVLLDAIERGLDIHALTALACFHGNADVHGPLTEIIAADASGMLWLRWLDKNWVFLVQVPAILEFFKKGAGKKFRQMAKNSIFGLVYGQGPGSLMIKIFLDAGIWVTVAEAARIQEGLLAQYPGLRRWMNRTRVLAEESRLAWTPMGRCYDVGDAWYTKSINTPCQGGAAEIMNEAMAAFPQAFRDAGVPGYLVMTVHDELIAEVQAGHEQAALTIMKREMEAAAIRLFPNMPRYMLVEGSTGANWKDAKNG